MERIAPGSPAALRESNRARVLEAVHRQPGLTHADIARGTGLSPASVTNIVRALAEDSRVTVADAVVAGRHCRIVMPAQRDSLVVALDFGRTHLSACLARADRRIVAEYHGTLSPEATAKEGIALSVKLLAELLAQAGEQRSRVTAAVVGVPGPLDEVTGQIGAGTLLPRWTGTDLPTEFSRALDLPVHVENDANLGAYGEYAWPPGRTGTSDLVYVRITTGIGAGLIIDGRLYRGTAGTAGEIGHVTVDERGPMCRCGNRGCLETLASIPIMLAQLEGVLGHPMTVDSWIEAVRAGEAAARRMIEEMGGYVGVGIAGMCNLINPSLVIVGGPIVAVGDALLDPIRDVVRRRAIPAAAQGVSIEPARFGRRSELYGAIALAIDLAERLADHH